MCSINDCSYDHTQQHLSRRSHRHGMCDSSTSHCTQDKRVPSKVLLTAAGDNSADGNALARPHPNKACTPLHKARRSPCPPTCSPSTHTSIHNPSFLHQLTPIALHTSCPTRHPLASSQHTMETAIAGPSSSASRSRNSSLWISVIAASARRKHIGGFRGAMLW